MHENLTESESFFPPHTVSETLTNISTSHHRIAIIGDPGTGKTTLAKSICNVLDYKYVSLDHLNEKSRKIVLQHPKNLRKRLFWQTFRKHVSNNLNNENWVTDGDYRNLRDIIWSKADTVIWLDYNFVYTLRMNLRRTMLRTIFNKEKKDFHDNYFSLKTVKSEYMIYKYLVRHYRIKKLKKADIILFKKNNLKIMIFHSPEETYTWLNILSKNPL